jgi:hypothetical protein
VRLACSRPCSPSRSSIQSTKYQPVFAGAVWEPRGICTSSAFPPRTRAGGDDERQPGRRPCRRRTHTRPGTGTSRGDTADPSSLSVCIRRPSRRWATARHGGSPDRRQQPTQPSAERTIAACTRSCSLAAARIRRSHNNRVRRSRVESVRPCEPRLAAGHPLLSIRVSAQQCGGFPATPVNLPRGKCVCAAGSSGSLKQSETKVVLRQEVWIPDAAAYPKIAGVRLHALTHGRSS